MGRWESIRYAHNSMILQELKLLSGRVAAMEEKVYDKKDEAAPSIIMTSGAPTPQTDDNMVLPSICRLRHSKKIQTQVDTRISHLHI